MSDKSSEPTIAQVATAVTVFIINILGNTIILLVVKYSKYVSHVTRHLIAHVAVADIIFGCAYVIHSVLLQAIYDMKITDTCIISLFFTRTLSITCSVCSAFGICLILTENYLLVNNINSQSGVQLTLCKARICIVSFWATFCTLQLILITITTNVKVNSVLNTCGAIQFNNLVLAFQMMIIISILITMLFLMTKVMLSVRKGMERFFQCETTAMDLLKQRRMKKNAKLATLFILIAVGFIVSWAPAIVGVVVKAICPHCVGARTFDLLSSFIQINSCVNFVVYVIKDKSFKKVCLQLLKKHNQVGGN